MGHQDLQAAPRSPSTSYGNHASGALMAHPMSERIAIIQLYYAVVGFTIILAGAALAERRVLEKGLAMAVRRAELAG